MSNDSPTSSTSRMRVLVVDDEPDNVALLTRILSRTYEVDSASSGPEALEKLELTPYDIIVTDQRMPGMSGSEFLAISLELRPQAIRIVVSAFADMVATLEAINVAGASAFLRKPIDAGTLEGAISRAVERKSAGIRDLPLVARLLEEKAELERRLEALGGGSAGED